MKLVLTIFACLFAFTISAQTLLLSDDVLYMKNKEEHQTLGFLLYRMNASGIVGVELKAIGVLDAEAEALISDFLFKELKLRDGAFDVDFSYDDSAQPITILTNSDVYDSTLSPKQLEFLNKPPLWRAGQHTVNAVSWGVGGSVVATGAILLEQPILGGVIAVISSIGIIVERVKTGRALQEASESDSLEPNREERKHSFLH